MALTARRPIASIALDRGVEVGLAGQLVRDGLDLAAADVDRDHVGALRGEFQRV